MVMSYKNTYEKSFKKIFGLIGIVSVLCFEIVTPLARPAYAVQPIVFPVIGSSSYSNDFSAPRSNGMHQATDIFAAKGQKIVAAMGGTITFVAYPQPSWGYAVFIKGDDGYTYNYIHLNNDTPGTDDGRGGPMNAYPPDVQRGNRVVKGQFIGYVGDSGNAETTPPHLHFEMVHPDGHAVNPYRSLQAAPRLTKPANYPRLTQELLPHGPASTRLVSVAMGNFDSDGNDEVITATNLQPTNPQIKIYNQDKTFVTSINPYGAAYQYGFDVAAADVDNDNIDEIVIATGKGYSNEVKVLKVDGSHVATFKPFGTSTVGLNVAAGDVDGDGFDEIVVSEKIGSSGPMVKSFKLNHLNGIVTQAASFNAYGAYSGGVDVAVGDVANGVNEEIITGPTSGASSDIRVYTFLGVQLNQFLAYDNTYKRGVRVSAGNVRQSTAKAEIVVVPVAATSHAKMFNTTGTLLREHRFVEEWWRSTFDIAAGNGYTVGSTGINRRTTVRFPNLY
jgi:hypothetical protein